MLLSETLEANVSVGSVSKNFQPHMLNVKRL